MHTNAKIGFLRLSRCLELRIEPERMKEKQISSVRLGYSRLF